MVESLPYIQEVEVSTRHHRKVSVAVPAGNPITQTWEGGTEFKVQGHSLLHSQSKASLGYMKPGLRQQSLSLMIKIIGEGHEVGKDTITKIKKEGEKNAQLKTSREEKENSGEGANIKPGKHEGK